MAVKGIDMLRRLLGDDRAIEIRNAWAKLSPDFAHYVTTFIAGEIWSRPHLDLRTRSLVTIAGLTALNRPNALRLNIEMALTTAPRRKKSSKHSSRWPPTPGFLPAGKDCSSPTKFSSRKPRQQSRTRATRRRNG